MSKLRVGLLSLIVLVQGLTIVVGFMAYQQMSERYTRLQLSIEELLREHFPGLYPPFWGIDTPNPFLPLLLLLVLFGASLTIVLLVDEVQGRKW